MNNNLKKIGIFLFILTVSFMFSNNAFADAGQGLYDDFIEAVKGSVGTTAGLAVSLVGLYMWIWNQVSWGIVVALGGALLTAFPGIYESIGGFGKTAFSNSLGTGSGGSTYTTPKKSKSSARNFNL